MTENPHQTIIKSSWTDPAMAEFDFVIDVGDKKHENKCSYNAHKTSKYCRLLGCNNTHRNSQTGLCKTHRKNQWDIVIGLKFKNGTIKRPSHTEVADSLIDWANQMGRQNDLRAFLSKLSISVLGSIPDTYTLAGLVQRDEPFSPPMLPELFETHALPAANELVDPKQTTSFITISATLQGEEFKVPVRALVLTFCWLVVAEEANRGTLRNHIRLGISKPGNAQMGGAMPIAYFATRFFTWGVDLKGPIKKVFRSFG